jgi:hypothetical protein
MSALLCVEALGHRHVYETTAPTQYGQSRPVAEKALAIKGKLIFSRIF